MKYADVVYAAPGDAPAGMPTDFLLKGFRVIPILGATATIADVIAAYSGLIVRVLRNSTARQMSAVAPFSVVDDIAVSGPDWIRSPGFGGLTLQGGKVGVTYRVFWAEDCYEVIDPGTSPMLPGFVAPASSPGTQTNIGPSGATGQTANDASANKPVLATDGVAVPQGARGAYAAISAGATRTLGAPTVGLVWWRYVAALGAWCETNLVETFPSGARYAAGLEQLLTTCAPGDRLYVEARSCPTSAGNLTVHLTIN